MKILKKSKQEQGITLVALVVTIIVLLILAGVTISAVLGENGLVQKAKRATQVHQNAIITENNQMNNAANFINTIANNDSQADEEDEGEWWIPTEAELAELQAAGAINEESGIAVGLNVDLASASALSNGDKIKDIGILYDKSIPNIFTISFEEITIGGSDSGNGNSGTLKGCVLSKKVLDEVIKKYEDGGMTNTPQYGIFKNATQVPFWISTDNTISYECPFNLNDISYYISESYYNRVMPHIRSAIANPVQL